MPALRESAQSPRRGLNTRALPPTMPSSGTSSVAGAELAGCCSQQGKKKPKGRTPTCKPSRAWQSCLSLAAISAFTAGYRACHMGLLAYKRKKKKSPVPSKMP